MDTVILTNNVATPTNEEIKLIVVKNQTETVPPKSKECINGTDNVCQENDGSFNNNCKSAQTFQSSVKTGSSQTPVDIRGQGDWTNVFRIRPYPTEKTRLLGAPDFVQRQSSTSTSGIANTSSTLFVPYVTKAASRHDVLEEMKRKVSQTFMKYQNFQPDTNDPKSSCVPGTDYEYRTPGAHYKNKNGKIKRPMNAFMVWARDYRGHLASSMLNATNSEISVKLGQIWASMAPEDKKQYYDIAEKIKAKHRKDYPDWVYQPSAQTLKKKDESHVYTRTPTPPPNLMLQRIGHPGSVMDRASFLIPGSNNEDLQIADMPENSSAGDSRHESSFRDFGSIQSPCKKDFNFEIHQKAPQDSPGDVGSNPIRPLYVARVSYQSTFELPKENTVSETTRGLLASKLSLGRSQSESGTNLSPTLFASPGYQQRDPFVRKLNISTTPLQQFRPSRIRPASPVLFTPGASTQQPRILGIVAPPSLGRLQVQNSVRLHTVRPTLLQELLPNTHLSPHLTPNSQQRPRPLVPYTQQLTPPVTHDAQETECHVKPETLQQSPQTVPGTPQRIPLTDQASPQIMQNQARFDQAHPALCVPKDIPIVETHISPISAHVRSIKPSSKPSSFPSTVKTKVASHPPDPSNEKNEQLCEDKLQTTFSGETDAKNDKDDFSNDLQEASRPLSCKYEDFWTNDKEDDGLWPFPFSENPADWDVKEMPSSLYMELFDPYDPFLTTDTLLSKTFPGSLQLDMERWKRYLEDDDGDVNSDPLKSLTDDKADDFIPSPLPLKQTLCRLLNAHVQESDTGDIITGDLVMEKTLTEETDDDAEEFETSELLTEEMAIELSYILKEHESSYKEKQEIAGHVLDSILDKLESIENTRTDVSETDEGVRHEFTDKETEVHESEYFVNEQPDAETCHKGTSERSNSDTSNCDSDTFEGNIKSVKSETHTDKTEVDENLQYLDDQFKDDSSERVCNNCVKILNNGKQTSGDTKTQVVDEKNFVAEAPETESVRLKTSSDDLTISHNTRSRTRSSKLPL